MFSLLENTHPLNALGLYVKFNHRNQHIRLVDLLHHTSLQEVKQELLVMDSNFQVSKYKDLFKLLNTDKIFTDISEDYVIDGDSYYKVDLVHIPTYSSVSEDRLPFTLWLSTYINIDLLKYFSPPIILACCMFRYKCSFDIGD